MNLHQKNIDKMTKQQIKFLKNKGLIVSYKEHRRNIKSSLKGWSLEKINDYIKWCNKFYKTIADINKPIEKGETM